MEEKKKKWQKGCFKEVGEGRNDKGSRRKKLLKSGRGLLLTGKTGKDEGRNKGDKSMSGNDLPMKVG